VHKLNDDDDDLKPSGTGLALSRAAMPQFFPLPSGTFCTNSQQAPKNRINTESNKSSQATSLTAD
jgi:hypothetical protein